MPSIIMKNINVNHVLSGSVATFGDSLVISPQRNTRSTLGSGNVNNGNDIRQFNKINQTYSKDADMKDSDTSSNT